MGKVRIQAPEHKDHQGLDIDSTVDGQRADGSSRNLRALIFQERKSISKAAVALTHHEISGKPKRSEQPVKSTAATMSQITITLRAFSTLYHRLLHPSSLLSHSMKYP